MQQIAIVGAGGFGREVLAMLRQQLGSSGRGASSVVSFGDDPKAGQSIHGVSVLALPDFLALEGPRAFVVAIADGSARQREVARFEAAGVAPFTVSAVNAQVFDTAKVGEGAVLAPLLFRQRRCRDRSALSPQPSQLCGARLSHRRLRHLRAGREVQRWCCD